MVAHVQEQTNVNAGTFLGVELGQVFRKAVQDTMQSHDKVGTVQETGPGQWQEKSAPPESTIPPLTYTPSLGPNKTRGADFVDSGDSSDEDSMPQFKVKRNGIPSLDRRTTLQSTYAEYESTFGTLLWRSRAIKISHKDEILGCTETRKLESYFAIRPARWLLARCLSLQISRACGGWTWRGQQFPMVAKDALIFKYCKEWNLAGVKDLFQRKLASPFDINCNGRTPLHVRKRKLHSGILAPKANRA